MLAFFHQLFENFKNSPARKNKIILICSILSLVLNLAIWALLIFKFRPVALANPEQITMPLHYNIYWGIDLFGRWYESFIIPVLGLTILIINFILAIFLYSQKSLASYFFIISAVFVQAFLITAMILIILINI